MHKVQKTSTSGIADNINDADFFTFTAGFTGSVSTLVKADGSKFDPFATAYLQDGSNYKLLISDDNSGGGIISKMDFNVTEGKTYSSRLNPWPRPRAGTSWKLPAGKNLRMTMAMLKPMQLPLWLIQVLEPPT
ncbi:MAG: hypothetical protein EBQ87_00185, partial [Planctomycetes bacterium]|nr:hypothetical protein [Planctomycetota bacterium]